MLSIFTQYCTTAINGFVNKLRIERPVIFENNTWAKDLVSLGELKLAGAEPSPLGVYDGLNWSNQTIFSSDSMKFDMIFGECENLELTLLIENKKANSTARP